MADSTNPLEVFGTLGCAGCGIGVAVLGVLAGLTWFIVFCIRHFV